MRSNLFATIEWCEGDQIICLLLENDWIEKLLALFGQFMERVPVFYFANAIFFSSD